MNAENLAQFKFHQIGVVHSCYLQKFGIPRQPGIATAAEAELELLPPYNQENFVRGLDGFSHIWIQFIFHQTMHEGWRATICPPRLAGRQRMGVFATRSTHRPNPIGISVVRLESIQSGKGKLILKLGAADFLDKTPVIDIKPYLPYSDAIPDALGGFSTPPSPIVDVRFSEHAKVLVEQYEKKTNRQLSMLITQILGQDPRPYYLKETINRRHGIALWDINIIWMFQGDYFLVTDVEGLKSRAMT